MPSFNGIRKMGLFGQTLNIWMEFECQYYAQVAQVYDCIWDVPQSLADDNYKKPHTDRIELKTNQGNKVCVQGNADVSDGFSSDGSFV